MCAEMSLAFGELVEPRHTRVFIAMHRMAETRHTLPCRQALLNRALRDGAQRVVVDRGTATVTQRVVEELRGITGRAEKDASRTQQPRGDRALYRLGCARVRHPSSECAR